MKLTGARDGAALRRAVRVNERLVRQLAFARDDASVRRRGRALWESGLDLKKLGRFAQAAQRFEEAEAVLRRFSSQRDLAVNVAIQRATALIALERLEEALEVLSRVVDEVGVGGTLPNLTARVPEMVDVIPVAVGLWLFLLEHLGRMDEAASAADAVIFALDPGATAMQRSVVADAFRLRGVAARARGDRAQAFAALQAAIELCDGGDLELLKTCARAMTERAVVLGEAGRTQEALAACDEMLARFGTVSDEIVQEAVATVRKARAALTS
jgi:tetratricopeptide (TPR) repeat protein